MNPQHIALARDAVRHLEASKIREVANAGAGLQDVIALWFGEPDQVTPEFVRMAAKAALDAGQTFYAANLGIAPLREAIAKYQLGLGRNCSADRVAVTASGVAGLMLCCQALLTPADKVVVPTPHWPHLAEIPKIMGAKVQHVPLSLSAGRWTVDLGRLLAALTPDTRMVVLNSPANPTGWTLSRNEQRVILDYCRQHGIWVLADEVYDRISFAQQAAPSFLDLADAEDRVVAVNSFSKSWAMTGWRLGWITAPEVLLSDLAKLNEYNISSPTTFVQHAGTAALEGGEQFVHETVERYRRARDTAVRLLRRCDRLRVPEPEAGMYVFFTVEDCADSLGLAKELLIQAKVGLAPGIAFGASGEGCLRLCFAGSVERVEQACGRIVDYLSADRLMLSRSLA